MLDSLLENQLRKISDILLFSSLDNENDGLFTGKTGISLFLFYAGKYYAEEKYTNRAFEILYNTVSQLKTTSTSICEGITGLAWTINHLQREKLMEADLEEILTDADEIICDSLAQDFKTNNFEYLYGAVGKALYLLERNNKQSNFHVSKIIKNIYEKCYSTKTGTMYWEYFDEIKKESIIDLGIAHGMSGIIILAKKAHQHGIESELCEEIINKMSTYIVESSFHVKNSESVFPKYLSLNELPINPGLRWCYGDLSIAIALIKSVNIPQNQMFQILANMVSLHAAKRIEPEDTLVTSAILCHGAAGVALIFKFLNEKLELRSIKNASRHWYFESTKLISIELDSSLIKIKKGEAAKINLSLIEGISGIGLTYLSYLSRENLKWQECLQLIE